MYRKASKLTPPRTLPTRQPRCPRIIRVRSTPEEDVSRLQGDVHESLSDDASTQVSDLVDTDRTGELLIALFSGMFGKKKGDPAKEIQESQQQVTNGTTETCVLGAGCYWTLDACFRRCKGVVRVETGFAGGHTPHPNYKQVCAGGTGHAEVVRIEYDPQTVSYAQLLSVLSSKIAIDLEAKGGSQAAYPKPQYRPILMYGSEAEQQDATHMAQLQQQIGVSMDLIGPSPSSSRKGFWAAAPRHQNFYKTNLSNSYCLREIAPTLKKLEQLHPDLFCHDL